MSHEQLSAAELFTLCAGSRDHEAWLEFHRRYHRTIAGVALKTLAVARPGRTDELEDLIHEVYARLCQRSGKALQDFVPTGPNSDFAYLKVITRNVVLSHCSSKRVEDDRTNSAVQDIEIADPASTNSIDRKILIGQIDNAVRSTATDRDRQVFWLYYRSGLTAEQISSFPTIGLSAKGVESALSRLTRIMKEKFANKPEGKARGMGFS